MLLVVAKMKFYRAAWRVAGDWPAAEDRARSSGVKSTIRKIRPDVPESIMSMEYKGQDFLMGDPVSRHAFSGCKHALHKKDTPRNIYQSNPTSCSNRSTHYWYAYHPAWQSFLEEGDRAYILLGC